MGPKRNPQLTQRKMRSGRILNTPAIARSSSHSNDVTSSTVDQQHQNDVTSGAINATASPLPRRASSASTSSAIRVTQAPILAPILSLDPVGEAASLESLQQQIEKMQQLLNIKKQLFNQQPTLNPSTSTETQENQQASNTNPSTYLVARRPKIINFQGDSDKVPGAISSVHVFLTEVEAVTQNLPDSEKISIAKEHMVGKARTLLLMEECLTIKTWTAFKELMITEYAPSSATKMDLIHQLANARRKPRESFREFCDRLRNRAAQVDISTNLNPSSSETSHFPPLAIDAILKALVNNVPPGNASFLLDRRRRPESTNWREIIETLEVILEQNPQLRLTQTDIQEEIPVRPAKNAAETVAAVSSVPYHSSPFKGTPHRRRPHHKENYSPYKKNGRNKPGRVLTCFQCEKTGHFARNCPEANRTKQKKNSNESKVSTRKLGRRRK